MSSTLRLCLVLAASPFLAAGDADAQHSRAPAAALEPASAPSAAGDTVDALVRRALAENPEVQAMRAEVAAAEARVDQAGLRPNPMLEVSGAKATSPDYNVMVSLSLPLDLNGRKDGRVDVARREVALRRAQLRDVERTLAGEVRTVAGESLAARRNLRFTEELLDATRRSFDLIRGRVREGANPPLEAGLLEVELNRLDASRRLIEGRVEVADTKLKFLVGLPPDASVVLHGDLANPPAVPDQAEALRRALESRADLEAARAGAQMAQAMVRKERAEGRWDASVSLSYQRMRSGFDLMAFDDNNQLRMIDDTFDFFGLGVAIELPVRNANQGNVRAASAMADGAGRRLALAELQVRQEIAAAYARHAAARRALDLYASGVRDVARRNLDVVWRAYELGRTSLLDAIAEQRRYIEIETGFTDALGEAYEAAVVITRAVEAAPAR